MSASLSRRSLSHFCQHHQTYLTLNTRTAVEVAADGGNTFAGVKVNSSGCERMKVEVRRKQ